MRVPSIVLALLVLSGCAAPQATPEPQESGEPEVRTRLGEITEAPPPPPPREPVDVVLEGNATSVELHKGLATFNLTSDGPIEASLLRPDGGVLVGLAASDEAASEEATVRIPEPGLYTLEVVSNATWRVRVTQDA